MGKVIKFWPLIIGILSLVAGYAVLSSTATESSASIREHEVLIHKHSEDIAMLKTAQAEYSKNQSVMMQDIKELLRRSR